jgi:phosphate transport system permease protein
VVRVTIPTAVPGILTGVILAIGRAVGETAALLFTMGTQYELVKSLRSGSRVLAVHLYFLVKEGLSFDRAFATGTILVVVVLLVNYATNTIVKRRVMNR